MLHLRDERDLETLGLPPSLLQEAKGQLASTPQIPDVGDLSGLSDAELWAKVEQERLNIRRVEKEVVERGLYLTAARYRRGVLLRELKRRSEHGAFEAECRSRKIKSQRASEDMRIADFFPNEVEAGKVPVAKALKLIKSFNATHGPFENCCFACPQWLRDAITRDYGFPGLDVASSHNMHFGEHFYTPEEDGLQQDWVADCGGKIVWCNPPYQLLVLGQWVEKSWREAQRGCVVVCMLPSWKGLDWFKNYVKSYAEVRIPAEKTVFEGFGPQMGKSGGDISGRAGYETIIAIFRQNQKGFLSGWIGSQPESADRGGLVGNPPSMNGQDSRRVWDFLPSSSTRTWHCCQRAIKHYGNRLRNSPYNRDQAS